MQLEITLIKAIDLCLSESPQTVSATFSFAHTYSIDSTPQAPVVSTQRGRDEVSGLLIPVKNTTVWKETLMYALPALEHDSTFKVLLWEESAPMRGRARSGASPEPPPAKECLGIVKCKLGEVLNKNFRVMALHPRANKKDRTGTLNGVFLGRVIFSVRGYSSIPLFVSPHHGAAIRLAESTAPGEEEMLLRKASLSKVTLQMLRAFVAFVDWISWRNKAKTFVFALICALVVRWQLWDATLVTLAMATAVVSQDSIQPVCIPDPEPDADRYAQHSWSCRGPTSNKYQLYGCHCRFVNAAMRALWWSAAGHDVLALQEVQRISVWLSHFSAFRVVISVAWLLYFIVGSEKFMLAVLCCLFVFFPLYLRSPTLLSRHFDPQCLPSVVGRIAFVPENCQTLQPTSRSVSHGVDESELIHPTPHLTAERVRRQSTFPGDQSNGVTPLDGRREEPARRRQSVVPSLHIPPTSFDSTTKDFQSLATPNGGECSSAMATQRRATLTGITRPYAIVSLDLRSNADAETLVAAIEGLYVQFDAKYSFHDCTSSTVDLMEMLRRSVKAYSMYFTVSIPPELQAAGEDSPAVAAASAEQLLRGFCKHLDVSVAAMFPLQSRLRGSWLVHAGEGSELASTARASHMLPKWLIRMQPATPTASMEGLLEAKVVALLAAYFLQARKLALYHPADSNRVLIVAPLGANAVISWNHSTPCPKPLREGMESVWTCESPQSPLTTTPATPLSDISFTIDDVMAMLQAYRSFWELQPQGSASNLLAATNPSLGDAVAETTSSVDGLGRPSLSGHFP